MKHGSLFSGIGGFELGAERTNIKTLWSCELNEFCRKILKQHFPETKQYNDIRSVSYPESVDIISGGFPCQDISIAGKGNGITGTRSSLWFEMYRIIEEIRPTYILIENSPELLKKGFEKILYPLSEIGYNVEWQCLSGYSFGVQQSRERVYVIAYSNSFRQQRKREKSIFSKSILQRQFQGIYPGWRTRRDIPKPATLRTTHDIPNQMDRTKAIGNSVMPIISKYLFECIKEFNYETLQS